MKTIEEAITGIYENIDAIAEHNETMATVFLQSFAVGANTIEKMYEKNAEDTDKTDISEYLEMLNEIFGVSMNDLVVEAMRQNGMEVMSDKEADQATLDFITSDEDLDDYERFVKQNQAKENLDFLKNEI
jgi:hypothetical protein